MQYRMWLSIVKMDQKVTILIIWVTDKRFKFDNPNKVVSVSTYPIWARQARASASNLNLRTAKGFREKI